MASPGTPARTHLGVDEAALREAFNADAGKARVLALVSPTCGVCLRGATDMQNHVFGPIEDQRLAGYIVWVPKLNGEERHVGEATHTVGDAHPLLGRTRSPGPRLRPRTGPGYRRFWMHQLGSKKNPGVDGPFLDPKTFAGHIRSALQESR